MIQTKINEVIIQDHNYSDCVQINFDENKYELVLDSNNKVFIKKKKLVYPNTFEKCCEILNMSPMLGLRHQKIPVYAYNINLIAAFQELLICRDAYWKLLEYTPKWEMYSEQKYCIKYSSGEIKFKEFVTESKVLAFPFEGVREIFYNNFKELIEKCKELL